MGVRDTDRGVPPIAKSVEFSKVSSREGLHLLGQSLRKKIHFLLLFLDFCLTAADTGHGGSDVPSPLTSERLVQQTVDIRDRHAEGEDQRSQFVEQCPSASPHAYTRKIRIKHMRMTDCAPTAYLFFEASPLVHCLNISLRMVM